MWVCVFIIILFEPSTEEAYPSGPPMTGKAGATGPDPSLEQLRSCGYCENGNAPHGSGSFLKFARGMKDPNWTANTICNQPSGIQRKVYRQPLGPLGHRDPVFLVAGFCGAWICQFHASRADEAVWQAFQKNTFSFSFYLALSFSSLSFLFSSSFSFSLSTCPFIHLPTYLPMNLSTYLTIYRLYPISLSPPLCLFVYPSIYLSNSPCLYLSIPRAMCVSISQISLDLTIFFCMRPPLRLSIYLPICLSSPSMWLSWLSS